MIVAVSGDDRIKTARVTGGITVPFTFPETGNIIVRIVIQICLIPVSVKRASWEQNQKNQERSSRVVFQSELELDK